jgi:hypothetical protein
MTDSLPPSTALEDYRATFGTSLDVRRLWRDRRAILADPRIASQPRPPLGFPPLRFALALVIVPMLALGWLSSQLAGAMYPDGAAASPIESGTRAIEAPLDAYLGAPPDRELRAMRIDGAVLAADAKALRERARARLDLKPFEAVPDALGLREGADAFVAELKASALPESTRRALAADVLLKARARRHVDAVSMGFMRSMLEGGAGMQVMSALVLVVAAWRFRRSLRNDPRFPRREQAGAFYLYYTTARLFWLSMLSILVYGVLAFASAAGDMRLFDQFNIASQVIGLASLVYLLCYSGTIARALRDDDELPKGAAFAIGRKLVWSQLVAIVSLILLALLLGIALGAGASFWYLR